MWRTGGAEAGGEGLAAGSHNEQRLIAHTADAVYNGGCRGRLWGGRDALPRQPLHCGSPGRPAAVTPAGVNFGSQWEAPDEGEGGCKPHHMYTVGLDIEPVVTLPCYRAVLLLLVHCFLGERKRVLCQ